MSIAKLEARKLAQQPETQRPVMAAAAKTLQQTAARIAPEMFGDTSKISVLLPNGVVAFSDLVRVGPGPFRHLVHSKRTA